MEGAELIRAFGERIGLGLELDDSGSCAFSSDGITITMTALEELESIALTADLGNPPPEKPDILYRQMLEANYLFNATAGATLSLNGENGHACLCSLFPCRAAVAEEFFAAAERFASVCEAWFKIVANYRWRVENDSSGPEADPFTGLGTDFLRV